MNRDRFRFVGQLAGWIFAGGALFAAAAWADPPPWAPAHGYRAKQEYRYVYYPQAQVYYAPDTHVWFWLNGGNWQFGASLPVIYQQYATGGVSITLDTDRPYTEHAYVVEHYGGPGHHGHRHHHHDDDD
ncbi:MAG: hypothetical protein QJR02_06385 [Sinobacteraceae bacterium]|nr:hypothetical protein [Nevskiaceae bacterium]